MTTRTLSCRLPCVKWSPVNIGIYDNHERYDKIFFGLLGTPIHVPTIKLLFGYPIPTSHYQASCFEVSCMYRIIILLLSLIGIIQPIIILVSDY